MVVNHMKIIIVGLYFLFNNLLKPQEYLPSTNRCSSSVYVLYLRESDGSAASFGA